MAHPWLGLIFNILCLIGLTIFILREEKKGVSMGWYVDYVSEKMDRERLADVYEALEKMRLWMPLYSAMVKKGMPKAQAREALLYIMKIHEELEYEKSKKTA